MHHSVSGLDCRSCKGAAIAQINNDSGFSTVELFFIGDRGGLVIYVPMG